MIYNKILSDTMFCIIRGIFNLKFLKNLQEINMEYTDGYARHFTQKKSKTLSQSNLKIIKITNLQDSLLVPLPGARIFKIKNF